MNNLDLFDRSILDHINNRARKVEDELGADAVFYHGPIDPACFHPFRGFIEEVKRQSKRDGKSIALFLRTGGGMAEGAERMVCVLRKHYESVYFVVPDMAMSAGTILCMAGDRIYMDYASSLGPIDPQVQVQGADGLVPALGYLDKVKEITDKTTLAPADVIMLEGMDLARLALFEQARDLSIDLVEGWLVDFKFKNWTHHRTTNPGTEVTRKEKLARAEEIAEALADHKKWRSHERYLDVNKLHDIGIEIDDYSDNEDLRSAIREYNDLLTGYIDRMRWPFYLHSHLINRQ